MDDQELKRKIRPGTNIQNDLYKDGLYNMEWKKSTGMWTKKM